MTVLFLDNYTDDNATQLVNHTSDHGRTYSEGSEVLIHNNRLYGSVGGSLERPEILGVTTSNGSEHTYTAVLHDLGGTGGDFSFFFGGTTLDDCYWLIARLDTSEVELKKYVNGSLTHLPDAAVTFTDGQDATVKVIHKVTSPYIDVLFNDVSIFTSTDNTHSPSGKKIFYRFGGSGEASTTTTGLHLDSFKYEDDSVNQKPTITLDGNAVVNHPLGGGTYVDGTATANDTEDGDISGNIQITGDTVNENLVGTYIRRYNVTDSGGLAADEVTVTVNVVDMTIPVITLTGDAVINITNGGVYNEQGAVWNDNVDGTGAAVVGGDTVQTNVDGSYTVTYNYTDAAGNVAVEVTRTVNVTSVSSTLNLSITNIPNGTYETLVLSPTYQPLFVGNIAYASEAASVPNIPIAAGQEVHAIVFDNANPHEKVGVFIGATE
jgi:hypothetical protein